MKTIARYVVLTVFAFALSGSGAVATSDWGFTSLGDVSDPVSAANAVGDMIASMGTISSTEDIAYIAAYSDEAISRSAVLEVEKDSISISYEEISVSRDKRKNGMTLEENALAALREEERRIAESLQSRAGQDFRELYRDLFSTVTFRNLGEGELTVVIEPDIRDVDVDIIQVETPLYSISFSAHELGNELTENLVIRINDVSQTADPEIMITMTDKSLMTPITLSLPSASKDLTEMAIMDTSLKAYMTRRNEVTSEAEGMIFGDGTYGLGYNGTDFEDIKHLSEKTQRAIRTLAAKGITTGTSATTFSPDDPLTRGQFVTFLMRCFGTRDAWSGTSRFSDVRNTYCYAYANAAAKRGYIDGYSDGTFRPHNRLLKQQICKILGNALREQRKATVPTDRDRWLNKYNDSIISYARDSVSILTRMGYIQPPWFNGGHEVTRAERAVLLYDTLLK